MTSDQSASTVTPGLRAMGDCIFKQEQQFLRDIFQ